MKKETIELIVANGLIAICIAALLALGALFSSGCHGLDDQPFEISEKLIDDTETTPRYWVVLESAKITTWKVETADYLPDPWAAVYRLGDQMGTTASCDMETYSPVWEDHTVARTVVELATDEWTIVLYDYELEPSGNNWIGMCRVDADPGEIEHEFTLHLDDCEGAVESIAIRFERYSGDVDTDLERNPNC